MRGIGPRNLGGQKMAPMRPLSEYGSREELIRHAVGALARELEGTFSPETIARFVDESMPTCEMLGCKISFPFLSIVFRDRLRALAKPKE